MTNQDIEKERQRLTDLYSRMADGELAKIAQDSVLMCQSLSIAEPGNAIPANMSGRMPIRLPVAEC